MASTSQTLIIGANVWDGLSAQTAPGQVLVVDGRIQRVGDAIEAPPDARVVDLSGHTLTPGFMDCHVHVTLAPPLGLGGGTVQVVVATGVIGVHDVLLSASRSAGHSSVRRFR